MTKATLLVQNLVGPLGPLPGKRSPIVGGDFEVRQVDF